MDIENIKRIAFHYSRKEDFHQIEFQWNGKFGHEFEDANYEFRIQLCEFIFPQIEKAKIDLIRDLYIEFAKSSEAAWGAYMKLNLLGQELLIREGTKYLMDYLEGASYSVDTYAASAKINISKELAKVLKGNIRANWQPDNKGFWYRNTLADSSKEYWYVEVRTGAKTKLTDSTPYVATNDNGIVAGGIKSRWMRQRPSDSCSPDKQWIATIRAGNVYLRSAEGGGEAVPCSFNGDTTNPYGHLQWSPDSKHLVVFHIYPVVEKPVYYVLSSVDTTTRGILQSHEYAQPVTRSPGMSCSP